MAELFLERLNLEQYRHLFVANGVIKTKHLAAMGASVYGKRRDGGQHHGRRSSKSAPGSSVALVLGGGLALIAVGGLLAYALVGGSSERKEGERASA